MPHTTRSDPLLLRHHVRQHLGDVRGQGLALRHLADLSALLFLSTEATMSACGYLATKSSQVRLASMWRTVNIEANDLALELQLALVVFTLSVFELVSHANVLQVGRLESFKYLKLSSDHLPPSPPLARML